MYVKRNGQKKSEAVHKGTHSFSFRSAECFSVAVGGCMYVLITGYDGRMDVEDVCP